jgi:hypothetical protein
MQVAESVTIRGDTDFANTADLDRWEQQGLKFILGIDAHPKLVKIAEGLETSAWKRLERLPKYEILTSRAANPFATKSGS